jgi:hypothetical protein
MNLWRNEKGVALVFALLMSLAIMAMVTGVLYFVNQSTAMSGAGKRYATAAEAADGAINVMKDTINLTMWGEAPANVFPAGNCIASAILNQATPPSVCTTTLILPSGMGANYTAQITISRLYNVALPGSRLEFARAAGGAGSEAIFFRITSRVQNPGTNTTAESSALYRFAG